MEKSFFSPAEIAEIWVQNGVRKANLRTLPMFLLALFAGMFISLGSIGYLTMTGNLVGPLAVLGKLLGAALFPMGLVLVILCGAELFTGNNLLTLALLDKKITVSKMLRNWILVYLGNCIGAYVVAFLAYKSGLFSGEVMANNIAKVAEVKANLPFIEAVIRAMFCNILVVLACWMQAGSKCFTGKILSMFFPITLFVLSGFEHSIANVFFIPLGQLCGANVTFAQAWLGNILPVTLGNMIGGALLVPSVYYFAFIKKDKKAQ